MAVESKERSEPSAKVSKARSIGSKPAILSEEAEHASDGDAGERPTHERRRRGPILPAPPDDAPRSAGANEANGVAEGEPTSGEDRLPQTEQLLDLDVVEPEAGERGFVKGKSWVRVDDEHVHLVRARPIAARPIAAVQALEIVGDASADPPPPNASARDAGEGKLVAIVWGEVLLEQDVVAEGLEKGTLHEESGLVCGSERRPHERGLPPCTAQAAKLRAAAGGSAQGC